MPFDPSKGSDWAQIGVFFVSVLGTIWAFLKAFFPTKGFAYNTFQTKEEGARMYVRISEPDGKRNYVHPDDLAMIKQSVDALTVETKRSNDESAKLRELARAWMEKP